MEGIHENIPFAGVITVGTRSAGKLFVLSHASPNARLTAIRREAGPEAAVGRVAKSQPYVRSSTELLSRYLYRHAIQTTAETNFKSRGRGVTSHI
jgi:hypothetical protein